MLEVNAHGAKVVNAYSQGLDLPHMNLDQKTRHGVCAAISAHWIGHRASAADFWPWIGSVRGKASVINSQATGELNVKRGTKIPGTKVAFPGVVPHVTSGDPNEWIEGMLSAKYKVFRVTEERTTRAFLQAAEWITHATGQYVFIGLYGPGVGHAVAAEIGKGILFMDPNVGEVTFPAPGNFMAWFPKFVGSYSFRDTPTSPVKRFSSIGVQEFGVTRGRR
jgi:YopT peptidase